MSLKLPVLLRSSFFIFIIINAIYIDIAYFVCYNQNMLIFSATPREDRRAQHIFRIKCGGGSVMFRFLGFRGWSLRNIFANDGELGVRVFALVFFVGAFLFAIFHR